MRQRIQKASLETRRLRKDPKKIATDDFLWVNEDKSKDISIAGDELNNDQKVVVQNILQIYAEVFEETIVAGGANVEPMRIEMKVEWSSTKLQPMRKYTPSVQAAMEIELEKQLKDGMVEPSDGRSGAPVLMVRKESSDVVTDFVLILLKRINVLLLNPSLYPRSRLYYRRLEQNSLLN